MNFIEYVLQEPSYKWKQAGGALMIPTRKQLLQEAFARVNIFRSRKNWTSIAGPLMIIAMIPFLYFFLFHYFSLPLLLVFLFYTTVIMGTHGTIWYHRYCTHKAYTFSHPLWRFLTQHLVIRTVPEETYVISHHVHHAKADQPGDPYNAKAGFLYCMLAEINHQPINKTLSDADYQKTVALLAHTGIRCNTYNQYRYIGSVASPVRTLAVCLCNWTFWYTMYFFIGGHALACTLFSAAMFWLIFIRAFNFTAHGKGKSKHVDGLDFDHRSLAINQSRPGLLTGEWHNNHHLYPGSARAGFLPYQFDLAWLYIYAMYKLGGVSAYHDSKKEFLRKYKPPVHNKLL